MSDKEALAEWAGELGELLVLRRDALAVHRLDAAGEVVYFGDTAGSQELSLMKKLPLPCLTFRRADIAEAVAALSCDSMRPSCALRRESPSNCSQIRHPGFRTSDGLVLISEDREWLSDLVHAVIEFRSPSISPPKPASIQEALAVLRRLELATATSVTTTVDGHAIRPR